MKLTVAFPYRDSGCEWRAKSFPLVREAFARILPDAEYIIADTEHDAFNRAASRNYAVECAGDGIVILADTDMLPDERGLISAINAAEYGGYHIPFSKYCALSQSATNTFFNGRVNPARLQVTHSSTKCNAGTIVILCDEWRRFGGMDERFSGWGFEDTAFALVVNKLAGGVKRHCGTTYHLWHPSDCKPKTEQYQRNEALFREYERKYK